MSDLVVFYSLSGRSRQVGGWLAAALGADIDEIVEARPRGFEGRGIIRSLVDSYLQRRPHIRPMKKPVAAYDRVLLVTPVWAARLAGPARTWLRGEGANAKTLGLVLQSGAGTAYPRALAEFASIVGRRPEPLLTVSEADHNDKAAEGKVTAFAANLRPKAARFETN